MSNHFDTFENEVEISRMIKTLQAKSIDYMKRHDAWEVPQFTNPIKRIRRTSKHI